MSAEPAAKNTLLPLKVPPPPGRSRGSGRRGGGGSGASSSFRYSRIYKKTSQDGRLVLFLPQRELMVTETAVEPLLGVALVSRDLIEENTDLKIFIQVVLVFRYGREDEELMGLRFCNEIVVAAEQLHPTPDDGAGYVATAPSPAFTVGGSCALLDDAVEQESDFQTIPFALDLGASAPPSVRLLPCRPYSGSPIGTMYEVQLFPGETNDELPKKRNMVTMAIRLYESVPRDIPARSVVAIEKRHIFSDTNLIVQIKLDSAVYTESEEAAVSVRLNRPGGHGARKLKVAVVQQVGVAMFSAGNFKNVIGSVTKALCPGDAAYADEFRIPISRSKEFSWIAMDETAKHDADIRHLSPSVVHATRAMFIIRVQYYVQVVLSFGMLHRDLTVKLPFLLKRKVPMPGEREKAAAIMAAAAVAEKSDADKDQAAK